MAAESSSKPSPSPPRPAHPARRLVHRLRRAAAPPAGVGIVAARPKAKRSLTAVLRQWHQRIGLTAAFFVLWLGVSGTLLTRSNELGFDTLRLRWGWLTAMYGLRAEAPRMGFEAAGHWMAATKENTLLDAQEVSPRLPAPVGFVSLPGSAGPLLYIGTPESLVIAGPGGERIDELRAPILPIAAIRRIGVGATGAIAVQDYDAYESSDGGNSWTPVLPQSVTWSEPKPLPAQQRADIEQFARPSILVEQVLIDLHSGRLFGVVGAWIITVIGLLALLLSISGVWTWWRIRQSRRKAASGG